ncbi:MAG: transaldolase [Acidimicrobiaceae bacterium]|nr:transaldolase [Acidimicrobiaceae bacterium]
MNELETLYETTGQSPWIDNLSRAWINSGRIEELKEMGVRGLTSNPTIFANAISNSDSYDKEYFALIKETDTKSAYWRMACGDVTAAADVLMEIYQSSGRNDGFVSIEVDPELAHDTQGTIDAAQWLWDSIGRENLMIKIPATVEGIPAITEVLSRGISVNVTLIFALDRYKMVMDAHIKGIYKAREQNRNLGSISSVASFFVSRVDTKLDPILKSLGPHGESLMGRAAVAQAQAAYLAHTARYQQADWTRLSSVGAKLQRPLWASTSTKNPSYPDLLYVETLIAPNTVNTMPESTLLAFVDHGHAEIKVPDFARNSNEVLTAIKEAGIDLKKITSELETEGVASFANSFHDLLAALEKKKHLT